MSIKAIIFDFDGVIVDTEPLHLNAFQKVLSDEGIELTSEVYYSKYLAYDDKTFFYKSLNDFGKYRGQNQITEIIVKKSKYFDEIVESNLVVFDGVAEFVKSIAGSFRTAIGSGALRNEIENILDHIGLSKYFEFIVSANEVEMCKPNPEVFIKVLERFNNSMQSEIFNHECLVFEDSVHGIIAAKEAGMNCIAVSNSCSSDKLSSADLIINSFNEISVDEILNKF